MSSATDGMASSQGDPRVLFVMNLVLSGLFSLTVLWGLDLLGVTSFTYLRLATMTLVLMAVTHLVTR